MSGATSNLAAATWLLLQTTLPTTQSSSLDFWELSSEYFILRSFELFFKLSPSFWCRTKASSLHPPSKLAATANTTSYNNITIVLFGLRLAFRIIHSDVFLIIVHTVSIFLVPYKSSCYSPLDIGTDADTDATHFMMGSENLSFSIFRDGAAEYFVMLLQEDPIAKVREMFCERLTFFFLTGCSFQKASLSIKCHFLSCPNDNTSIQSFVAMFWTFLELWSKHQKIVNVK